MKKKLIYSAALFGMTSASFAATFNADEFGNWGTPARWGGTEPTSADDAFVRNGTQHVFVTLDGEVANRLTLGQSGSSGTLTVLSGSLTLAGTNANNGTLYYSWGGVGDTTGIVNLEGGSLTVDVALQAGNNSAGDIARLNISGGTLSAGSFNSSSFAGAESSVNITGSDATIGIVGGSTFQDYSTLKFDFDGGTTVSAWDTAGFTIGATGTTLTVVGSTAMGVGTYELVTYSGAQTGSFATESITGLASGLSGSIVFDGDSMNLVVVPEPGSYAMLGGLLAIVFVGARRRR